MVSPPGEGGRDKRDRGTSPFPVRGGDRGGKNGLAIKGGIKVGEGKRRLGVPP